MFSLVYLLPFMGLYLFHHPPRAARPADGEGRDVTLQNQTTNPGNFLPPNKPLAALKLCAFSFIVDQTKDLADHQMLPARTLVAVSLLPYYAACAADDSWHSVEKIRNWLRRRNQKQQEVSHRAVSVIRARDFEELLSDSSGRSSTWDFITPYMHDERAAAIQRALKVIMDFESTDSEAPGQANGRRGSGGADYPKLHASPRTQELSSPQLYQTEQQQPNGPTYYEAYEEEVAHSPRDYPFSDSEVTRLRRGRFRDKHQEGTERPQSPPLDTKAAYEAHRAQSPVGYRDHRPDQPGRYAGLKKWVGRGPKTTGGPRVGKRVRARDYSKPYESPLPAEIAFTSGLPEMRVAAYCISSALDILRLAKWIRLTGGSRLPGDFGSEGRSCEINLYVGAVHVSLVPEGEEQVSLWTRRDIFFFNWGCVVFWATSEEEEQDHLRTALDFATEKTSHPESDDMLFCYGDRSRVRHDVITLITVDPREKLSLSFAMAQSVKLDMFESRVEDVIEEYRGIPVNMDKIMRKLSQKDLSKMIGKIFLERADINLNSDILDEPDFFWESDEWLPLYKTLMLYLEVHSRVDLLNAKLDVLKELLGVLNNQVQQRHGVRLEWIVIWLIVANVAVQVIWHITIKDFLGLMHHCIEK